MLLKGIDQYNLSEAVACWSSNTIGTHNQRDFGAITSPVGFGSNVSLSTLHRLCYRRKCKTRYVVIWLIFYDGTFTRKNSAALPSALEEPPKITNYSK
ncbi:hypothetical protein [Xenorhabdus bovienii]|uniref:hypothetical protein n=1 Tax=Xenorhabdus bovienii TaxID=40576 RepID=UPI00237D1CC8|nr:hypothetical protein [Xenorhabdus bovienii]